MSKIAFFFFLFFPLSEFYILHISYEKAALIFVKLLMK